MLTDNVKKNIDITDKTSLYKEVWDKLSAINVNENVDKKMGLSYLSWAWAYTTMMKNYPSFDYKFDQLEIHQDGSVTIHCVASIILNGEILERYMWLPVMDYKNKAITNPSSVDINKTKMRCLTKAISMFGLGIYIYAGEDYPESQEESKIKPTKKDSAPEKTKYLINEIGKIGTKGKDINSEQTTKIYNNLLGGKFGCTKLSELNLNQLEDFKQEFELEIGQLIIG